MPTWDAEFRRLFEQLTSIRGESPIGKPARVRTACILPYKEVLTEFPLLGKSFLLPWGKLSDDQQRHRLGKHADNARLLSQRKCLGVPDPREFDGHFPVPQFKQCVSVRTRICGGAGQPCLGRNWGRSDSGNTISFSKAARRPSRPVIGERFGLSKTSIRVYAATGQRGNWQTALRGLIGWPKRLMQRRVPE